MRIVAPPGVFRPISDSWMLADALRGEPRVRGGEVLDLCCGSGALGIAAGRAGAARVTAVDVSRRAVATAQLNGMLNGVAVRGRRGDLFRAVPGERFDVIASNPPYVPAPDEDLPARGPERAWHAGRDGRALLDRICGEAADHLRAGGALLLVHSSVCGEQATLERLGAAGLEPEVAARHPGPLGPLLSARAAMLEERGLLTPGRREEEVLVIRGRAPAAA